MIVSETGDRLRVVTQGDHARFAAELLSLWRGDGLPEHPRREELLFAVREHDNGWRESDSAPRVDPVSGLPHSFSTLPDEPRRELWERGLARYREERPYATALILEHALLLHRTRAGRPDWDAWLASLAERRRELHEEISPKPGEIERDAAWLRLADRLSLAVCLDADESFREAGRRFTARAGDALLIDPLPLAGATSFDIPVRYLPLRRYSGDADLGGELAAAPWRSLRAGVREASPSP